MLDFRDSLISRLREELTNDRFISLCRDGLLKSFSRNRVFTISRLIVIIMFLQRSYRREIDSFVTLINEGDYNIKNATSGALSQARAKLNPKAFTHLSNITVKHFYEQAPYSKWNGYRLLAVDGSVLNLPYSKQIVSEFGHEKYIKKASGKKSMARCSVLYDVKNHITLDAQIASYTTSEKALLHSHLKEIKEGDLILGDRGYGLNSIIYMVSAQGADFCIRLAEYRLNKLKEFMKSEKEDTIIELSIDPETIGLKKGEIKTVKIRVVKITLETGEIELLGTSLFDKKKYNTKVLKKLYHLRWGVEEVYKMLKSRVQLEEWSGRTARSIYQDFEAKILMMNLCAVLSYPIEQKVRDEYKKAKTGNKYDQKINRSNAISVTKDNLFKIFFDKGTKSILNRMDKIIKASRTIIRPGRKTERIKQVKKRKPLNYKRL